MRWLKGKERLFEGGVAGVASGKMFVMVDVGWRRHRGRLGSCSGFVLGKAKTTGLGRSCRCGSMT